MARKWSLHKRGATWYGQVFNPATGRYLTARSTGEEDKDAATLVIAEWLKTGLPSGRMKRPAPQVFALDAILHGVREPTFTAEDAQAVLAILAERKFCEPVVMKDAPDSVKLGDFLREFWDEDKSPYVEERHSAGYTLTLSHIRESGRIVERYWAPLLGEKALGELRRSDIKAARIALSKRGLSVATTSRALACLGTALRWACENDILKADPMVGLEKAKKITAEKGILAEAELGALFAYAWDDNRCRVAFMLAATCGLRLSECLALQAQDVDGATLHVRHGYNREDKLKTPKNGKERTAALLPEIVEALAGLLGENPHVQGPETFLFYSGDPAEPVNCNVVARGFNHALAAIGIDEAARMKRHLSFHSLRHGYAKAVASRVESRIAMRATGHMSEAMLRHYSDHATDGDQADIAAAQAAAFGKVIAFKSA